MKNRNLYLIVFLLLLIIPILSGCSAKVQENNDDTILVQYFYENICGSCDVESEFIDNFETYTGISAKSPNLKIEMYNIFLEKDLSVWEKVSEEYDLQDINIPVIRVDDNFEHITNIKDTLEQKELLSGFDSDSIIPNNASVAVLFSSPGCHDCIKVEEDVISHLPKEITIDNTPSPIKVLKISTAEKGSIELFRQYCEDYKVIEENQKTPIVFVGYTALCGPNEIADLPSFIEKGDGLITPILKSTNEQNNNKLLDYGWLGILATGLLNGLNPCAISMLLMLLSLLAVDKKSIAPVGFSFAAGKFIGFFLLGTVLFSVVDMLPLKQVAQVAKIILLVLSGVMVLLNLNDLLAAKSEKYNKIRLQLPQGLRKRNHNWIKKLISSKKGILLIACGLLLGLVLSAGEFLCTGQIYLAVIVQVVHSGAELSGRALIYLLLYCTAFITPLLIMIILVIKGRKIFSLSDNFRRNMAWIKLGNMLIFMIFFLLVLLLY